MRLADTFTMADLTQAVANMPYAPTLLRTLGIFNARGVRTRTIALQVIDNVLTFVPATRPGTSGLQGTNAKGKTFALAARRHRWEDTITAAELQGALAFGTDEALKTVASEIQAKQLEGTNNLDLTLETVMLGAISGVVDYGNGDTESMFSLYGVLAVSDIDLDLGNASADLRAKYQAAKDVMVIEGKGKVLPGTEAVALYSPSAWDAFVSHPAVAKAYELWQQGEFLRGSDQEFRLWGFRHIRYLGGAGAAIADGDVRLFPLTTGPNSIFQVRFAPADRLDSVNTEGQPRYSWLEDLNASAAQVVVETDPVLFVTHPRTLIRAFA